MKYDKDFWILTVAWISGIFWLVANVWTNQN